MKTSCSWCDTMNDTGTTWCVTCGHRAHMPRAQCDCGRPGCQTPAASTYRETIDARRASGRYVEMARPMNDAQLNEARARLLELSEKHRYTPRPKQEKRDGT